MSSGLVEPAALVGVDTSGERWCVGSAIVDHLARHTGLERTDVERQLAVGVRAGGIELDAFELRLGGLQLDLRRRPRARS